MNLAMYNLPSNLKSSLHKTWQTLLLFLKPLQMQTPKRKKWGDMAYYNPTWKSGGTRPPCSPPNCAHVTNHDFGPDYKPHKPKLHGSAPKWMYTVLNIFSPFTIFEQLALALKTEGVLNSQYWWYIFYHSGCKRNLRLPWKTELPWYFHCIKHVFFIIQEFWVTCA